MFLDGFSLTKHRVRVTAELSLCRGIELSSAVEGRWPLRPEKQRCEAEYCSGSVNALPVLTVNEREQSDAERLCVKEQMDG